MKKSENKTKETNMHFIRHICDLRFFKYPIKVHNKYHRLKDKIRQIKNSK